MDFLEVKHINKSFGGVNALKDVSINVIKGHILGLVGQNGCGKSTLMNIVAGVLNFDSGEIVINGKSYKDYDINKAQSSGIGIIYQDLSLFPNFTVLENIYISMMLQDKHRFIKSSDYRKEVEKILKTLGISFDLDALVEDLPIAKQQLVAIARALINKSRLIILDEPTTALTRTEINNLFTLLRKLQDDGISFIFISHKLNELLEICNEITVMRDGKVVETKENNNLKKDDIETLMLGRSLTYGNHENYCGTKIVLKVENLSRKNSFAKLNFTLKKGEVLGIAGQLGSGRTEMALALFGVEPAQSGKIFINDKEVRINSIADAKLNKIAYVPENRLLQGIVLDQSIARNSLICTLNNYLNNLNCLDLKHMNSDVDVMLHDLQVKYDKSSDPIRSLSGGNQQKVVIAKWLATNPEILILDSPTVGIDVGAKNYIYEVIKNKAKEGLSIIVISDEAQKLASVSDRVLVMKNGRIVQELQQDEISAASLEHVI